MYKQKFGNLGEELACTYLENKQFEILARNYRSKFGEIDVVALRKGTLHFIEVKTRSTDRFGKPAEAVDREKISKILRLAQVFIKENKFEYYRYSFDVIEVYEKLFMKDGRFKENITIEKIFQFYHYDRSIQNILFKYTVYIERVFKNKMA